MKRILLVIMTLALVTGLMLGTAGSAMAATNTQDGRGIFGTVQSMVITDNITGVGNITLVNVKPVTASNATVEIQVTENTTYHIPSVNVQPTQRWQTWQNLTSESRNLILGAHRVAILLTEAAGHVAAKVMVVPAGYLAYRYHHHLGVVVAVSENGTATIAEKNGDQVAVTLGEGVQVEVGQLVLIVTDSNGGTELKAIRAYRIDKIADRFEGYLEGSLTEADFDNITDLIQQTHDKYVAYLQSLKSLLEAQGRTQAAARVQTAIDYANARFSETMQFRNKIKEWVDSHGGWTEWQAQWGDISGTITAVNTGGRTIEVNTGNGTLTLHVPAAVARIVKHNALFVFKSLAVGDQLEKVIYYKSTGVNEALYIRVAD